VAPTAPDDWLNPVARIAIAPGRYLVGTGQEVVLPSGPDRLGTLTIAGTGATFARTGQAAPPFQPVPDAVPQLRVDPVRLELRTVDGTPTLRVRDMTRKPAVPFRHFPDAPAWSIHAKSDSLRPEVTEIEMKEGSLSFVGLTHRATFQQQGKTVMLMRTRRKPGNARFAFRDAAAGDSYPACRFVFGEDATDRDITLDFNRAISPPRGFTDFAVCPPPPPATS
jgi:hypothetical protein